MRERCAGSRSRNLYVRLSEEVHVKQISPLPTANLEPLPKSPTLINAGVWSIYRLTGTTSPALKAQTSPVQHGIQK